MRGKGFGKYKRLAEREGAHWRSWGREGKRGGSPLPRYAPPIQNQSRLFSGLGVGEEELLAFKLEAGDGLLGIGADPPVDELLGGFLLDLRALGGVDNHDAVLVQEGLVAFDEDLQGRIALGGGIVLDVGAAVGHGVAVFFGGDADGGHHALAGVNVPRGVLAGHFHAGDFPQLFFGVVRAGVVAAAHEGDLLFGEGLQGGGDVFALDAGRVGGGSDQHEVVVHHLMAVHAEAVGHELFLKGGGVYEQHVDVAVFAVGEGFARAYGNPFQIDARVLFEDGLEIFQKAGVLRAGGGRHHQGFGVGHLGQQQKGKDEESSEQTH